MQKVALYYPCGGSVHPAFTKSLLDLQRFEKDSPAPNYELLPIEYSASLYVQENRNLLVELAQRQGADWILMVDTDESFQPTLLRQLMKTADVGKRPIVFGLYSNVQLAPENVQGGFYVVDMIYRELADGQYECLVSPNDVSPFTIDAAGTGVFLSHLSVYQRIPYPWFELCYIHPTGKARPQVMNEDIAFCRKAREAGYVLWCDPLAEAIHYKTIALTPSSFRRFLERAREVEKEMRKL